MKKEGYEFNGWYDNAQFSGDLVTKIKKGSTGDKTFYAKWSPASKVDEFLVNDVIANIDKLPATITLDEKAIIELARLSYDRLPSDLQSLIHNYNKLTDAEEAYETLMNDKSHQAVTNVEKLIEELPDVYESNHEQLLDNARDAFYSLSAEQQDLVQNELQTKLSELEQSLFDQLGFDENKAAANILEKRIASLPDNITLEDKDSIEKVKSILENSSQEIKDSVTNIDKLTKLESRIDSLQESKEAEENQANNVNNLITNLPSSDELTLKHREQVQEALDAYNDLSQQQQYLVTNIRELLLAEERISQLEESDKLNNEKAQEVIDLIESLPNVDELRLTHDKEIENATEEYAKLTEEQKALVINYDKLVALETRLEELLKEEENNNEKDEGDDTDKGEGDDTDKGEGDDTDKGEGDD